MAGHSKWANIKHKKARVDAKRGKIFSRVAKEIAVAVKEGGGPDPKSNPRLRLVLQKARAVNMPNDNIERNIKKASDSDGANYDEVLYELYGHGGVGILCEALTDNKNRTASDLRIATNKRGGTLATPGAVSYNFERKGVLQVEKEGQSSDEAFLIATESGAEDFEEIEDVFMITTMPEELFAVKEKLEECGMKISDSSIEYIPKVSVECNEEAKAKNIAFLEWLESIDDIDTVYHNMSD